MRNETRIVDGDIDFRFSFYKWASNGIPFLKLLTILDGRCSKSRKADVAVGAHEFLKTGRERKGARNQREATKNLKDFFREALGEVYDLKMRGNNDEMKKSMTTVAKEIGGAQIFNDLKAMAADEENDVKVDKLGTRGKIGLVQIFSLSTDSRDIDDVLRDIQDNRTEAVHSGKSRNAASTNAPKDADHKSYDSSYDPSKVSENRKSMQEGKHFMASSSEVPQADSVTSPERDIDPFEVNFLVEVLSDEFENLAPPEKVENTKEIDAKVRQWSAGKKGNIQSLLSTLQFVLWPGSGWKPVPLVNLLEANSVKRAYQKAMLLLHPDKLQQKSAAFHHKYLAEKVFEILQEAWDHFNTLSHV